eukprot:scaffold40896_cov41-Cyclotella_meneghiniana.AAC.5
MSLLPESNLRRREPLSQVATGCDAVSFRPSAIMGFFRYADTGILTFKCMEMEGMVASEAVKYPDDTLHVVLHCQKKYFKHGALEHMFCRKFTMTDHSQVYILPENCIRGPMLVVSDIADEEESSKKKVMTLLSRQHVDPYLQQHCYLSGMSLAFRVLASYYY